MSPLQNIIRSIPTTAAEIGIVESVRNRLTEIGEIDRRCRPDGPAWINGAFCWLHTQVDVLAASFAANPTQAAAEELHAAIVRHRDAPASIEAIAGSLRHAAAQITGQLAPVIGRVFDTAAEKLAAEISARRAELAKGSVTMFDVAAEIAAHDAKGAQLAAQLEVERESAMANPVQFLVGHIEPQVPETPAKPTPAPAPPLVRGRQKLPEPKADNDVLSILAELEADE
jgi:hypothetical protein